MIRAKGIKLFCTKVHPLCVGVKRIEKQNKSKEFQPAGIYDVPTSTVQILLRMSHLDLSLHSSPFV